MKLVLLHCSEKARWRVGRSAHELGHSVGEDTRLPRRRQQVDAAAAWAHAQADGSEGFGARVVRRMAAGVDVDGPHAAVA
jgi:hypothetical protein